ncbi:hypothetical protein ABTZ03_35860 [Kitasatospora sp. NPDC096077]|uniref:hypothetical protein n=1 Tax=Kitasatospora sp. NPDC096077 TaxID=3155544 RepID=UPI0033217F9D
MAVADQQYADLMEQLKAKLPDLAEQLDQEFRQGRAVSGERLKQEGTFAERAGRLADTDLPALRKSDIAVVPYTSEEQIELIREALLTLAETMYASRSVLLKTAVERQTNTTVAFGDPELESVVHIDLPGEAERASAALQVTRALLATRTEPGESR